MRRNATRYASALAVSLMLAAPVVWALDGRRPVTAQVTDLLDELIQPRFQKDGGVFGMRRVVKSPGHEEVGALTDLSAWDKQQLARIQALKHDYRVSMLRIQHPPGKYRKGQSPLWGNDRVVAGKTSKDRAETGPALFPMIGPENDGDFYLRLRTVAAAVLPSMTREGSATVTSGNWTVTLRPVRATKESCVGCHRGAKQGDTLGVLVYAVNQDPRPEPSPAAKLRPAAAPPRPRG